MRSAGWLSLSCLAAACGSAGGIGAQPSWRQPARFAASAAIISHEPFAPGGDGARYFALAPQPPPPSELGDRVVAEVARQAAALGVPAPEPDARLFAAMTSLAPRVPDDGILPYALVEFALQHHGVVEPSPHLQVIWGEEGDLDAILGQITPRLPEVLASSGASRLGLGWSRRADGTLVVVFALQASWLRLQPIPRSIDVGRAAYLEGRLTGAFRSPALFVTEPDGSVRRAEVRSVGGQDLAAEVPCEQIGRMQLEVTAEDASGANVLANFPVWCGETPPSSMLPDPSVEPALADATDAEARLLALVNRDRVAAGLGELRVDAALAAVARSHSLEMRSTGVVAHVSPTTGDAAARLRAAGIRGLPPLENVARAYGVRETHAGLMGSPGHRANLLAPGVTHVGIGVVFGDDVGGRPELLVTQVFVRVPPPLDPAAVTTQLLAVAQTRRAVALQPRLTAVAQDVADELGRGLPPSEALALARRRLAPELGRFTRIGLVMTAVADVDVVTAETLLGGIAADEIGLGVARGPHPDFGDHATWVVAFPAIVP